jgi:hypothetical protein
VCYFLPPILVRWGFEIIGWVLEISLERVTVTRVHAWGRVKDAVPRQSLEGKLWGDYLKSLTNTSSTLKTWYLNTPLENVKDEKLDKDACENKRHCWIGTTTRVCVKKGCSLWTKCELYGRETAQSRVESAG